jgi:type II secretory pathway pseudopilin PulG
MAAVYHGGRGFTLIELLLVASFLLVLAGITFPRLNGSVRSASIQEAAEDLGELLRHARAEAVHRRLSVRFTLEADLSHFSITLQDRSDPSGRRFVPFQDVFLDKRRRLPAGVTLDRMYADGQRLQLPTLDLQPSGVDVRRVLRLHDAEGRVRYILLGTWLDECQVTVQPPEGVPETVLDLAG